MDDTARRQRRNLIAILVVFALFGAGAVVSARWLAGGSPFGVGDRVAVIPLRGTITDEDRFLSELERFRRDRSVRGFVIEIETPGGTVGASQAIYEAVRDLRDADDRPVLAWMGDVGASGGYYAAMGADSVFALPGTITGSIGVVMEFPNAAELYRKVGLGWEIVKSGEHKDMGNPSRALTESDRTILQSLVQDVHEQFVRVVADNRVLDVDDVRDLADGRIYSGRQAEALGLVDGLATLDETVELTGRIAGLGPDPTTVRPSEPRIGLLDLLFGLRGSEARGLLRTFAATHSGTPRLLYEWK